MRAKFYIALGAWVIIMACSHSFGALPAMSEAAQKAYTQKVQQLNLIGHNVGPDGKNNLGTGKNATDPQDPDKKAGLDSIDPKRLQSFLDRYYNQLPNTSQQECGKGTRQGMELLTGDKIIGTEKGGDLWMQLLKTGH